MRLGLAFQNEIGMQDGDVTNRYIAPLYSNAVQVKTVLSWIFQNGFWVIAGKNRHRRQAFTKNGWAGHRCNNEAACIAASNASV
jgi:hypothetical protein